jgi:hypothetical protein
MALTLPQPAETSLAAVLLLATAGPNRDRVIEELDEAESLRLISAGGSGRIAYQSPPALPTRLVVEETSQWRKPCEPSCTTVPARRPGKK